MPTQLPQLSDGAYFMLVLNGRAFTAQLPRERLESVRKSQGYFGVRALVDALGIATVQRMEQLIPEVPDGGPAPSEADPRSSSSTNGRGV